MTRKPEVFCKKLGLQFDNPRLFAMALTHRSAGATNNERLEFLGDSVLGFVIAQMLFDKFPAASEGVLSRLRAGLVNQESLAGLARKLDLGNYLLLGSGELKSGGYRRDSILSDALEAIMGAIVKDQGVNVCRKWILSLFADKIENLSLDNWQKDPKTKLQETMQSGQYDLPEYSLISTSGLTHEQTFKVECRVTIISDSGIGYGATRKKAEQAAAEEMLSLLVKANV